MLLENNWIEISLINVSSHGAMVRSMIQPAPGSKVEIRRRGSRITGEVVWATATRFGIRTTEKIDLDALTAKSELQPERRSNERPVSSRRARARWIFWNS